MSKNKTHEVSQEATTPEAAAAQQISGRSAFNVELTPAGVMIRTVFVGEDEQVRALPAVFPTLEYGLEQIEMLRRLVIAQFTQAAQIGMQAMAASQPAQETDSKPANDPAVH